MRSEMIRHVERRLARQYLLEQVHATGCWLVGAAAWGAAGWGTAHLLVAYFCE